MDFKCRTVDEYLYLPDPSTNSARWIQALCLGDRYNACGLELNDGDNKLCHTDHDPSMYRGLEQSQADVTRVIFVRIH